MLKNILLKCCELLSRDDLKNDLIQYSEIQSIPEVQSQNDILRMISYYNFITNDIFENYLDCDYTESFTTNKNGIVYFENFTYEPKKIKFITYNDRSLCYSLFTTFVKCGLQNTKVEITYSYLPKQLSSLSDKLPIKNLTIQKIIAYGIVSEFFASKNQYNESEFWHAKFIQELFRQKIKKERRLKSTFEI